jgi:anti-anti-sigma regulatory factor
MRAYRTVQIGIFVTMALVLILGVGFGIRTSTVLTYGLRYLTQDIGVWHPSQLEREVLRLHLLMSKIELGGAVSGDEYALQRDLVISRIATSRDTIFKNSNSVLEDQQIFTKIESMFATYQTIEGGIKPDAAKAQQLNPILENMASMSHNLLNRSRDAENANNIRTIDTIQQLQVVQVGSVVLVLIIGGILLWVIQRAFSTDLTAAYAESRQHAANLEQSQFQLSATNQELERQNSAVRQALIELEATVQARAQLEVTVQQLSFPVIPVLDGVLVLPLIGGLDHVRLRQAGQRLYDAIDSQRASVAIIDITGMLSVDRATAQELLHIAQTTMLLGCHPMLVGITPTAAEELVQLEFQSDILTTQSTLQEAVRLAQEMRASR